MIALMTPIRIRTAAAKMMRTTSVAAPANQPRAGGDYNAAISTDPANFDPTGNFIYAGNQDSANIVTFKVDKTNGMLTPAGLYTSTPAPACIQFA